MNALNSTRPKILRKPGALLLVAGLIFGCELYAQESGLVAKRAKPNIVLILVDDMGFGDPECFNPKSRLKTPSIDRLAKCGLARHYDRRRLYSVLPATRA